MKLYNTATRSVEELRPITDNIISLYTCGPTVYSTQHIGNWATFIRYDLLARWIKASGYELNWIMNITDVGHLVSDADQGEDKIEKQAKSEGKTAWQVARYYSEEFIKYLNLFNISLDQKNLIKATDNIKEQIEMIEKLEENGQTYVIDDGVYFDSSTFDDYGKMARLNLKGQEKGKRIEFGQKRNISDFALWKFSRPGEKRDMEWESKWGTGFPGWHLECSAIANKYLGKTLDIHSGGIEHIPIHHTNEIAQSESANKARFVNIWVHNNHLQIDNQKISKSLKNGITPRQLSDRGFSLMDFRLLVISSHYAKSSNFTWDLLGEARKRRINLQALADLRFQPNGSASKQDEIDRTKEKITQTLNNNLNSALALSKLEHLAGFINNRLAKDDLYQFTNFISWIDDIFGLKLMASEDISLENKELIKQRNIFRREKNYEKADAIREQLKAKKIHLEDIGENSIWSREV